MAFVTAESDGGDDCRSGDRVALPDALRADVDSCGFFPGLVCDSIELALGGELATHWLVQHEATFAHDAVGRHITVLVLTPTRLIVAHTDENPETYPGVPAIAGTAISSTESIPLRQIGAVSLTRVVAHPERAGTDAGPAEVLESWLTIGWQTVRKIDVEPASCPDPTCEVDHGYSGTSVVEDIVVRVSPTGDGQRRVNQLLEFAAALQRSTR